MEFYFARNFIYLYYQYKLYDQIIKKKLEWINSSSATLERIGFQIK